IGLVAVDRKTFFTFVLTLAAVGLPLLYWMNRTTHGWFWTYVFRLHQMHDFYKERAFVGTPVRLLLLLGPAVLLIPWAVLRARSPGLLYATFLALIGALAACLGFGTQWAFMNAFIPGVFYPALAIATAGGRLVSAQTAPRLRPAAVHLVLTTSL